MQQGKLGIVHICPCLSRSIRVHHAGIRASAIAVNLVKRHHHHPTWSDLRKLISAGHLHDSFCPSVDIIVTTSQRLTNSVGGITFEPGSVLLEWVTATGN